MTKREKPKLAIMESDLSKAMDNCQFGYADMLCQWIAEEKVNCDD